MANRTRVAAYLEQYASEIRASQEHNGRWDDLDAKSEHDELLELAAELRSEPAQVAQSIWNEEFENEPVCDRPFCACDPKREDCDGDGELLNQLQRSEQ